MKTVIVRNMMLRNTALVSLTFPYDEALRQLVKTLPGAEWQPNLKVWTVPYTDRVLKKLSQLFEGQASLECSGFQQDAVTVSPEREHRDKITSFGNWLRSKRYSESTVKTYTEAIAVFLAYWAGRPIEELTASNVVTFNNEYILKKKLSASYQNQIVNAVKLFFKTVRNCEMDINLVHRPRKEKKLPNVLSKEEVKSILDATENVKHKAMLSLIYACGLRRGEILGLKPRDMQSDRKLLFIRQSKGKKDRVVPISDRIIEILREYYKMYRPSVYLFEGETRGAPYSERSIQLVFKKALTKAKIKKPATLHWLRHSYATAAADRAFAGSRHRLKVHSGAIRPQQQ